MPDPTPPEARPPQLTPEEIANAREAGRLWSEPASHNGESLDVAPDLDLVEERGRPGSHYVRRVRSAKGFEKVGPGWITATKRATAPVSGFGRFRRRLRERILGPPLATRQLAHERLTKIKALAVLSSDALSSVAYAPEQILLVFAFAGVSTVAVGNHVDLWVMGAITFLLFTVVLSYRQTIKAYPKGGGSYIVAKDNLGPIAGLTAAASLTTSYTLTVAVSVASGISYLTSAFPRLTPYTVPFCIGAIVLITLGNLRGIRESGSIFAAPTYLFIFSMAAMLAVTFFKIFTGQCDGGACAHEAGPSYPPVAGVVGTLSLFLILQAFASGSSALTGVEAISDGVPAFKPPEWKNARRTLVTMGVLLGAMFVSITVATHIIGIGVDSPANPHYQVLLGKIAKVAFGAGSPGYYVVSFATLLILILAANTAFSDFPRLYFFLARDDYAPHQFKRLGERLAFSNGIIVLAGLAILLVIVFGGEVSRLLPLYAIGVFLAFTMSQAGMVVRWLRRRETGWRLALPFNFIGMCMTTVVFIVFAIVRFREGAWVSIVIIPTFVAIFLAIHRHYHDVESQLATEIPIAPSKVRPLCIVPIADFNGVALQSLAFARTVSPRVIAVHVCDDEGHIERMRAKWEIWGGHVPLEIIESPYRSIVRPLLAYIDDIDRQRSDDTLCVVLPELVNTRWWHQVLHNQSALRLKAALLFRPGTVVINVPYHLQRERRGGRRALSGADDPEAI
ncbi:MAG TPA: APC family permease [Candidatus Dormibacteraeota bacterium]|nr:APC family permease [Candidatus Dormibacteraeota bacterium]